MQNDPMDSGYDPINGPDGEEADSEITVLVVGELGWELDSSGHGEEASYGDQVKVSPKWDAPVSNNQVKFYIYPVQ